MGHGLWSEFSRALDQGLMGFALSEHSFLSIPWPVHSFVMFALAATAFLLIDQPAVADLIYFSLSLYGATQVF